MMFDVILGVFSIFVTCSASTKETQLQQVSPYEASRLPSRRGPSNSLPYSLKICENQDLVSNGLYTNRMENYYSNTTQGLKENLRNFPPFVTKDLQVFR